MSSDKPRIDPIDPEDLLVLREVDPQLPEMVGEQWRSAWDPLFRAAHQGTCWLAWIRDHRSEKSDRGDRDNRKPGIPVGYIAAQRQFFGKLLITAIEVGQEFDRQEVAAAMLRFVEGRQRGEMVLAAVPDTSERKRTVLLECGYELVGELRLPADEVGLAIFGKQVPERTRRPDQTEAAPTAEAVEAVRETAALDESRDADPTPPEEPVLTPPSEEAVDSEEE